MQIQSKLDGSTIFQQRFFLFIYALDRLTELIYNLKSTKNFGILFPRTWSGEVITLYFVSYALKIFNAGQKEQFIFGYWNRSLCCPNQSWTRAKNNI